MFVLVPGFLIDIYYSVTANLVYFMLIFAVGIYLHHWIFISSWVKIRFYTENQLHILPGSLSGGGWDGLSYQLLATPNLSWDWVGLWQFQLEKVNNRDNQTCMHKISAIHKKFREQHLLLFSCLKFGTNKPTGRVVNRVVWYRFREAV